MFRVEISNKRKFGIVSEATKITLICIAYIYNVSTDTIQLSTFISILEQILESPFSW